jgi:hypothetical protein
MINKIFKQSKPPTPAQQRALARRMDKAEWALCCESPEFIEAVEKDIKKAALIADTILNGWKEK